MACFPRETAFVRSVWDDQAWEKFVSRKSIFLNVHKTCNTSAIGADSVRFARVLNARGLMISQSANVRDMQDFEGLVDFAPLNQLAEVHRLRAAMLPAEREHLAQTRYEMFKTRHSPQNIFRKAGVYSELDGGFNCKNRR